ncbi:NAD(P)-binding Rossmann-fold superfamily protein [Wolffia australiana]
MLIGIQLTARKSVSQPWRWTEDASSSVRIAPEPTMIGSELRTDLRDAERGQRSDFTAMATPSRASGESKRGLPWLEWARGWYSICAEFLFQRIMASHLENPLPLPPLNGVTFIVTGCTSGIGLETARQLAMAGAHLVMAVRNTNLAHELIRKWQAEGIPLDVEVMEIDLMSLKSVVRFAKAWNARLQPVHVLINNAGIFSIGEPQRFSEDGYETHIQVNHLAAALLSLLLIPSLIRGSPSRIVNVNSVMHNVGFVEADGMNLVSGKRKFTSLRGYCDSKLAQIKFSSILFKRLPAEAGIHVVCLSPGIVRTNVARDLSSSLRTGYHWIPYFILDPEEGCRSSLFAGTDPQIVEYSELLKMEEWPVCPYISHDCRPANASDESHNLETSKKIWEKTLELVGLPADALEKLVAGEEVSCQYDEIDE